MKKNALYMPSTPLNVMICLAHAAAHKDQQNAYLILIDQKNMDDNPYFKVLQKTPLFADVKILPGVAKGRAKLTERNENFQKIKEWCEQWRPEEILVGSDRRVEFQYAMHISQSWLAVGTYLDDGLYSYAGKPRAWYKDTLNNILKKIAYGFWWKEPTTVGASSWIANVWAFKPRELVSPLDEKNVSTIDVEWLKLPIVEEFSQKVCRNFGMSLHSLENLLELDFLILIAHPNNILKMPEYEIRMQSLFGSLVKSKKRFAVKYHPRTQQDDLLAVNTLYGVLVLPSGLAFEFILPFVNTKLVIVGDVGTALLTAKWFRPSVKSIAVLSEKDAFQSRFKKLYAKLGIETVESLVDIEIE